MAGDALHGIFGGTFDPIHYGHLAPLRAVLRAAGLAEITYIPAGRPPHRPPPIASPAARLAMTRLAVQDDDNFTVSDMEIARRGRSYTIHTLNALRRRYPNRRWVLLAGADALLALDTWRCWQSIQAGAHLIAIARGGRELPRRLPSWWRAARVHSADELRDTPGGKLLLITPPPLAVSATEVRARIAAGEAINTMTPRAVREYIYQHKLYAPAS